jgi:hypothetical protein
VGLAESSVHRGMKLAMRVELEKEGYVVMEEPLFPPGRRLGWEAYRPDILGYRAAGGREEVAVGECETHPNMARFRRKKSSSLWFQPFLFREGSIRQILAVPPGRLHSVDL